MKKKPLTNKSGEARELTAADLKRARPMREADPKLVARWAKERKRRGRPVGRSKSVVSLSLDTKVVTALRATGSGWQTRVNELLKAAVGIRT